MGDYAAPRPWRFFIWILTGVLTMEWTRAHVRREAVEIMRRQRHRLANRVQVVDGWLQLGQTLRAQNILQNWSGKLAEEGRWIQGLPIAWTYAILRLDACAEARGLIIGWTGIDDLKPGYLMLWMLDRSVRTAVTLASDGVIEVVFAGSMFRLEVPGGQTLPRGLSWWVRWSRTDAGVLGVFGKPSGESAARPPMGSVQG